MGARRFANQVHKQTSRLLAGKFGRWEPIWYQAVLENPPLPLPARARALRTDYDLPLSKQAAALAAPAAASKRSRPFDPRPLPIVYAEDELRRQFFQDHPFEAFRPKSIVEDGIVEPEHPVQGKEWTRLRQRGRNPSPEDAIRYAMNLHEYHDVSLNDAYSSAVAQFRALRSERLMASKTALREAETLGIAFGRTTVERVFKLEARQFATWKRQAELDQAESTARKRWRMVAENVGMRPVWSRGRDYTRLWQEGIRPTYSAALAASAIAPPKPAPAAAAPSSRPAPARSVATKEEKERVKAQKKAQRIVKADYLGVTRPTTR